MFNIGIIGKGFVGSSIAHSFSHGVGFNSEIRIFDVNPSLASHSLEEVVNLSEFVFISVPTPSKKDGGISIKSILKVFEDINQVISPHALESTLFVLRSTVVPGTSAILKDKFPKIRLVFNPEFVTERSAFFDSINQARYVIGGGESDTQSLKALYTERFGNTIPIITTTFETAEMVKYMCNLYFATKISFLNEMKLISDKIGADWEKALEGFVRDGRIGHSHLNVPGHDGKMGFGGACFPKDIQAFIVFAKQLDISPHTLMGAWATNLMVRPEKDWEMLKGRAVTEDE